MPTYEYECRGCGHRFEIFQSINAGTTAACPKCSKEAKRLITGGAGIIFKGSGFYETDYKKKNDNGKPAACPMKNGCNGCQAKEG